MRINLILEGNSYGIMGLLQRMIQGVPNGDHTPPEQDHANPAGISVGKWEKRTPALKFINYLMISRQNGQTVVSLEGQAAKVTLTISQN